MTRRELVRNRALLGVLARDVVSITGSQMTLLALPWFVLTTTGSASRMALVLAVESASMAISGFLGGNVAARLGPRRTMLVADASRAPLVALIPLLHALDALSFPLILAIAAASAAFVTHSFAAKSSLIPELVGEDERVLSEANALLQGAQRITIFLGPALAGVLIAVIGAANVLLLDALSFAVGFLLVLTLVPPVGRIEQDAESRGLAAGFRFLARDRLLRPWTIAVVIGDVGWLVLFAAMPVLVLERFGEEAALLGWIWGAWGLGAVLGNVVSFRTVAGSDRLLVASLGAIAMIAPLWLLLTDLPAAAIIATMAASGFANGIGNPPVHALYTLRTPRALRAKVWSVVVALSAVLAPVAIAVAGPVLDSQGFRPVIFTLVAVQSLAALAFATAGLRERSRTREAVLA
jgi:predicted MFS family arabinose efflux permease